MGSAGVKMFEMVIKIVKWASLPVLLFASLFSRYATGYELLVDFAVCLGAIILVQRAVLLKQYFWAAGFLVVAIVFSPLLLIVKILFLMGFAYIATFVTLLAAFRARPLPAKIGVHPCHLDFT